MKVLITLVVIALLCLYLFFSVRSLIRSLKGLGARPAASPKKHPIVSIGIRRCLQTRSCYLRPIARGCTKR